MKRGILLIILIASIVGTVAVDIDSCQTLSSAGMYTLNQSVSSAAGCFSITADNVELDCQGYQITFHTSSANNGIQGIVAQDVSNITIRNCPVIDGTALGFDTEGIRYFNVSSGQIINNTIRVNGTNLGAQQAIYLASNTDNINVSNNIISAVGANGGIIGVFTQTNVANTIIRDNIVDIQAGGFDNNYGLYITTHNQNVSLLRNNVTAHAYGTSDRIYGLYFYLNVSNSQMINNTVTVTGDAGSPDDIASGITTSSAATPWNFNNTFAGNVITMSAPTAPYRTGINPVRESYSTIQENTITISNLAGGVGIDVSLSNHTRTIDNTVTLQGSSVAGLRDRSAAFNSTFIGNTINGVGNWIESTASATFNATYYNTTFNESGNPIRIDGPIALSLGTVNITPAAIEVNTTHAFVDTTTFPILNTSGRVTLTGFPFDYYLPTVDYADNGTFVECPNTLCTIVSQAPNLFVMDVAHFTTFSAQQGVAPEVPEFSTWVMLILLGVTMAGLVTMRQR